MPPRSRPLSRSPQPDQVDPGTRRPGPVERTHANAWERLRALVLLAAVIVACGTLVAIALVGLVLGLVYVLAKAGG